MPVDAPSEPLSSRTAGADDLTSTNAPDASLNEQTWPTEEEMGSAPINGREEVRRMKRVPKGTSAYQAAWIFDDDEDLDEEGDEEDDEEMIGEEEDHAEVEDDVEETEEIELDSRVGEGHKDLDPEEEEREWVSISLIKLTWQVCDISQKS
jgi:pre-rRNA-processing protein TSR1